MFYGTLFFSLFSIVTVLRRNTTEVKHCSQNIILSVHAINTYLYAWYYQWSFGQDNLCQTYEPQCSPIFPYSTLWKKSVCSAHWLKIEHLKQIIFNLEIFTKSYWPILPYSLIETFICVSRNSWAFTNIIFPFGVMSQYYFIFFLVHCTKFLSFDCWELPVGSYMPEQSKENGPFEPIFYFTFQD